MVISLLKISTKIKEDKELIEVKIKGVMGKTLLGIFLTVGIILILWLVKTFHSLKVDFIYQLFFILIGAFFVIIGPLARYWLDNMAIIFSKKQNQLQIKRICGPFMTNKETITLGPDATLILVKLNHPYAKRYYQLILETNNNLNILVPKTNKYNLLITRDFYRFAQILRFTYLPEDAREISRLIGISLKESDDELGEYITKFKRRTHQT